jgi:hypothetical protein
MGHPQQMRSNSSRLWVIPSLKRPQPLTRLQRPMGRCRMSCSGSACSHCSQKQTWPPRQVRRGLGEGVGSAARRHRSAGHSRAAPAGTCAAPGLPDCREDAAEAAGGGAGRGAQGQKGSHPHRGVHGGDATRLRRGGVRAVALLLLSRCGAGALGQPKMVPPAGTACACGCMACWGGTALSPRALLRCVVSTPPHAARCCLPAMRARAHTHTHTHTHTHNTHTCTAPHACTAGHQVFGGAPR